MDIVNDIHPLSAFHAGSTSLLQQLKATGRPIVLTIDGKAELVVQDAAAYQQLCELAAGAGPIAADPAENEPSGDIFEDMRRRLGLAP